MPIKIKVVILFFSILFFMVNPCITLENTHENNPIKNNEQINEKIIPNCDYLWIWEEFSNAPGDLPGDDVTNWGNDLGQFHNRTELNKKLNSLEKNFPNLIEVSNIGFSFMGNFIPLVRITDESVSSYKKEFFVVAHHHAREVITVENALYFIDRLVHDYNNNTLEIIQLLRQRIIYVIPSLNIDSLDIMNLCPAQRKNLHAVDEDGDGIGDEIECLLGFDVDEDGTIGEDPIGGIDLNRNYPFQWGYPGGSSDIPSSEVYRGTKPLSELETAAVVNFVRRHDFKVAVSLHSGITLVITPWSYNPEMPCPDIYTYNYLGNHIARITELDYDTLYPCSGEWADWMYAARGIVALTLETFGNHLTFDIWDMFNPHANKVIRNCEENVYPALKFLLSYNAPELEIQPIEDVRTFSNIPTNKNSINFKFLLILGNFLVLSLIVIKKLKHKNTF